MGCFRPALETDQFEEEKSMKARICLPILLALAALAAGCNTIHGAGEDLERGGEKIQQESAR